MKTVKEFVESNLLESTGKYYAIFTSNDKKNWVHEMDFVGTKADLKYETDSFMSQNKYVKALPLTSQEWFSKNRDYKNINKD